MLTLMLLSVWSCCKGEEADGTTARERSMTTRAETLSPQEAAGMLRTHSSHPASSVPRIFIFRLPCGHTYALNNTCTPLHMHHPTCSNCHDRTPTETSMTESSECMEAPEVTQRASLVAVLGVGSLTEPVTLAPAARLLRMRSVANKKVAPVSVNV